jgi:hypothetical protein
MDQTDYLRINEVLGIKSFDEAVKKLLMSRIYGGIHFPLSGRRWVLEQGKWMDGGE